MMFVPVRASQVAGQWPEIAEAIWPCVRGVPNASMEGLKNDLIGGRNLFVWAMGEEGSGALVLEITPDAVCWLKYGTSSLRGGPKVRLRVMREGMKWLSEQMAAIGCTEVRICGRDWSRILTDFQLMPDAPEPNLLRKVLRKEAA